MIRPSVFEVTKLLFSKIVHDLFESARCLVTLIDKFKCFILEDGQLVRSPLIIVVQGDEHGIVGTTEGVC